ncbi:hypothetical protein KI387_037985, partial [Taxus chinensis]
MARPGPTTRQLESPSPNVIDTTLEVIDMNNVGSIEEYHAWWAAHRWVLLFPVFEDSTRFLHVRGRVGEAHVPKPVASVMEE